MRRLLKRFIFLTLLVSVVSAFQLNAQGFQWAVGGGSWVDDAPNKVTFDQKGNTYTTGSIGSSGASFGINFPEWGFFLLKQDKHGTIKWVRYSTGSYNAAGKDVAVDSKGNVYVVGTHSYPITVGDTTLSGNAQGPLASIFLIKYDSNGTRKWARTPGIGGSVYGGSLAIDKTDNIYLAGEYIYYIDFGSGISIYTQHSFYYPYADVFLTKYDGNGRPGWSVSVSSTGDDYATALVIDPDQNVNLIGRPGSYDQYVGSNTYFLTPGALTSIIKFSATGNPLALSQSSDYVNAASTDSHGNLYLACYNPYQYFSYYQKLDAGYTVQWTKTIIGPNSPTATAITASGDNIYASGSYYQNVRIDSFIVSGSNNMFLTKLSDFGEVQWMKTIGTGGYFDGIKSLAGDGKTNLAIAGVYSESQISFDGHTITNNSGNGDVDVFIALMEDTVAAKKCPAKSAVLIADKANICNGDLAVLTPRNPGGYSVEWHYDSVAVVPNNPTQYLASAAGRYYFVRYAGTACADTSNQVTIKIIPKPANWIQSDPSSGIACGKAVKIQVDQSAAFRYVWYKNDVAIPDANSSSYLAQDAGTYRCDISNGTACVTNSNPLNITSFSGEHNFLPDTLFKCASQGVEIMATGLKYANWDYEWSTRDINPYVTAYTAGMYILKVYKNGCSFSDTTIVKNFAAPWFPNVFTPNGFDTVNAVFKIRNLHRPIILSVVNRWGNTVFQSQDYRNDWNGHGLEPGVYYYVARDPYQCSIGDGTYQGWVEIVK